MLLQLIDNQSHLQEKEPLISFTNAELLEHLSQHYVHSLNKQNYIELSAALCSETKCSVHVTRV